MDWPQMIDALKKRGWTQALLAEKLDIAQSAISELRNGRIADPRHSTGEALRTLYESEVLAPGFDPAPAAAEPAVQG